eukprot:6255090-Pyramimonas_sp.AAC.1
MSAGKSDAARVMSYNLWWLVLSACGVALTIGAKEGVLEMASAYFQVRLRAVTLKSISTRPVEWLMVNADTGNLLAASADAIKAHFYKGHLEVLWAAGQ